MKNAYWICFAIVAACLFPGCQNTTRRDKVGIEAPTNGSVPEKFDLYLTWYRYEGNGPRADTVYFLNEKIMGAGDTGLSNVMKELRTVKRGSTLLLYGLRDYNAIMYVWPFSNKLYEFRALLEDMAIETFVYLPMLPPANVTDEIRNNVVLRLGI